MLHPTDPGWLTTLPLATYSQAEFIIDSLTEACETRGPEQTESGWLVKYRPRKNMPNILQEVLMIEKSSDEKHETIEQASLWPAVKG
jgi:hypothetical protein